MTRKFKSTNFSFANIGQSRKTTAKTTNQRQDVVIPTVITDLADSKWTISYRFSDQPESRSTTNDDNNNDNDDIKRIFYSGKVTIQLRSDGYTDLL